MPIPLQHRCNKKGPDPQTGLVVASPKFLPIKGPVFLSEAYFSGVEGPAFGPLSTGRSTPKNSRRPLNPPP
jgi:hypothetical protein